MTPNTDLLDTATDAVGTVADAANSVSEAAASTVSEIAAEGRALLDDHGLRSDSSNGLRNLLLLLGGITLIGIIVVVARTMGGDDGSDGAERNPES